MLENGNLENVSHWLNKFVSLKGLMGKQAPDSLFSPPYFSIPRVLREFDAKELSLSSL